MQEYLMELLGKTLDALKNQSMHIDVEYMENFLLDIIDAIFAPRQILRQMMMISILQVKYWLR